MIFIIIINSHIRNSSTRSGHEPGQWGHKGTIVRHMGQFIQAIVDLDRLRRNERDSSQSSDDSEDETTLEQKIPSLLDDTVEFLKFCLDQNRVMYFKVRRSERERSCVMLLSVCVCVCVCVCD